MRRRFFAFSIRPPNDPNAFTASDIISLKSSYKFSPACTCLIMNVLPRIGASSSRTSAVNSLEHERTRHPPKILREHHPSSFPAVMIIFGLIIFNSGSHISTLPPCLSVLSFVSYINFCPGATSRNARFIFGINFSIVTFFHFCVTTAKTVFGLSFPCPSIRKSILFSSFNKVDIVLSILLCGNPSNSL